MGDRGGGQLDFRKLGAIFVKLFKVPEDELAGLGITGAMRSMAIQVCTSLQDYLKDDEDFPYQDKITFKFMIKARAKKPAAAAKRPADAGAQDGAPAKRTKKAGVDPVGMPAEFAGYARC